MSANVGKIIGDSAGVCQMSDLVDCQVIDRPNETCYPFGHMVFVQTALPFVQIGLSVLLIGAILMQRTGASLGGAFGADNFSSGFHTRRGFEKTLFQATIVIAILFALSAFVNLIIS